MAEPSVAMAAVWTIAIGPLLATPILILRKNNTAEINVIWYVFSLVFVIFWSLFAAVDLKIIEPVWSPASVADGAIVRQHAEPWTKQYFYELATDILLDWRGELLLVCSVVLIAIVPQLLTYVLAGLSGCASIPKWVWQFEQFAILSLIKFLAALGGFLAPSAFRVTSSDYDGDMLLINIITSLKGLTAVAAAFALAVLQIYFEKLYHYLLGVSQDPKWRPNAIHRFFTRKLKRPPGEGGEPSSFNATQIWEQLTPAQQQEISALVARSLLDVRPAANTTSHSGTA